MKFTNRLRELEAKATEGPWDVFYGSQTLQIDFGGRKGDRPCVVGWPGFDSTDLPMNDCRHNAALIAYLRNHAKEILALVEAVEELKADLPAFYENKTKAEKRLCEALAALEKEQS